MSLPKDPPQELRARVLAAIRREPVPARKADAAAIGRIVAAAALVAIAFSVLGGVHAGHRPNEFVVGTALGWACFALVASWASFGRGRSMLGRPRRSLVAVALATPLGMLAWMLFWNQAYPEVVQPASLHAGVVCFLITLGLGACPLVAFALSRRDTDPTHPRAMGAALGAASGAWGGVMIDLLCEYPGPSHVLFGHVIPVILLAILGASLAGPFLATQEEENARGEGEEGRQS